VASLGTDASLALLASQTDSAYMIKLVMAHLADAAVSGIGGVALIRLREPLSRRLFPADSPIALPTEVDFVGALLAVLGVYFVVTAIMDAAPTEIFHRITVRAERGEARGALRHRRTRAGRQKTPPRIGTARGVTSLGRPARVSAKRDP
jgi:hypothetical protein